MADQMNRLAASTILAVVLLVIAAFADAGLVADADGWKGLAGIALAVWGFVFVFAKEGRREQCAERKEARRG